MTKAPKNQRLLNKTLKIIMQSESKMAVDYFIRRFKSVQSFKPYKQVPKVLKYIQDLIKIIKRQNLKYLQQQLTAPSVAAAH